MSPSSLFYKNLVVRCIPTLVEKRCIENLFLRKYNTLKNRVNDNDNKIDVELKIACQTSKYSSSPFSIQSRIENDEPSKMSYMIKVVKKLLVYNIYI